VDERGDSRSENQNRDPLTEFLENYNYGFWYYKIFSIDEIHEDESCGNKVLGKLNGGTTDGLKSNLTLEMFMTSHHLIETLFMLIGAFTFSPTDPYAWINNRSNYGSAISESIRNNRSTLWEGAGFASLDDYVRFLFFDVPVAQEHKGKLDSQIEPSKVCLKLLATELYRNEDLYNAYKHGFIAHSGISKITYQSPSRGISLTSPQVASIWTKPKRRRVTVVVDINNESKKFDVDNVYFTRLDHRRQRGIALLALTLIKNAIEYRKVVLGKRATFGLEPLPAIKEIEAIFEFNQCPCPDVRQ